MKRTLSFVIIVSCLFPVMGLAQAKKIDLDDMMIKGELHNDDRLLILSRQKNELKNYIKFRTNYRDEILQQLPTKKLKRKYN